MTDLDWIFDTGETEYITAYSKSGPGIDLIINEVRAFILLGYLTHMLTLLLSPPPPSTPHCIHQLSTFLPLREITLSAMGPRYPPVLICLHLPDLHDLPHILHLSSSHDLHLLLCAPAFSFQNKFYLGTLLWAPSSFPDPQGPCYHSLNSLHAEAQCTRSLLIAGSVLHLFIDCRIWDAILCLDQELSKFTSSLNWLQLASIRLVLKNSKGQFWSFPTYTHTQLSSSH